MRLLSFLKFNREAGKPAAKPPSADELQRARTRARRRLIGAVVLLGIGIVGFPLVFETQPRPVPVDLPIEIPRKETAPPLALPKPRASGTVITESAAEAGREVPAAKPVDVPPAADKPAAAESRDAAPAATPPALAEARDATKPADKPVPTVAARPADRPASAEATKPAVAAKTREATSPEAADAARARALLDGKTVADAGRFVVQVGAFADEAVARETRSKVEKLGLKTYTQVVDTDAGKRIRVRVGPFGSRDEADKAAGRIRSAGLPSAILSL